MQLALEIDAQAQSAQREINIVKTAVAAKQRDIRMLELISIEVKSLAKDTKIYQGVGKMYGFARASSNGGTDTRVLGLYSVR